VKLSSPEVLLSPLHSPPALHPVALVDDQVKVTDSSTQRVVGFAEIEAVGTGEGTGAGVGAGSGVEEPPPPPHATSMVAPKMIKKIFLIVFMKGPLN
tara:strand:+ start:35 stop:325 length:291 start_codon:yes stop_codon:yes gene_type:complete